jgi:hypothetical protein
MRLDLSHLVAHRKTLRIDLVFAEARNNQSLTGAIGKKVNHRRGGRGFRLALRVIEF